MKKYSIQVSYAAYWNWQGVVEAPNPTAACQLALEESGNDSAWKSSDHVGDSFIDAIAEGDHENPWDTKTAQPIPAELTEAAGHMSPLELAAPDLLAALIALDTASGPASGTADVPLSQMQCDVIFAARMSARTAIAKAKGDST